MPLERKHKIFIGVAIAIAVVIIFLVWWFGRKSKEQLLTDIAKLKAEIVALNAALEAAQSAGANGDALVAIQRKLDECSAKLLDLQKQLDECNESSKSQIAKLSQQLATITAESTARKDQISGLTAQVNQLTANLSASTATITALKAEISGLVSAKDTLTAQNKDLTTQLTTLKAQLDDCNEKLAQNTASGNNSSALIDTLNAQITTLNTKIANLTATIDKITVEKSTLTTQLASANATIVSLNNQVATLTSQNTTLTTNNASLSTQITSLQNQINSGPAVGDLQAQLAAAISDRDACKAALSALQTTHATVAAELTKTQNQVTTLLSQLGSANTKIAALTADYDALKALHAKCSIDIAALGATITTLNGKISTLEAEKIKLTADLKAVTDERDQLKTQVATLTGQLSARDAKIVDLTSQLATCNTDLSALKVSYDSLMKTVVNFGLLPVIPYYMLSTSAGKCASVVNVGTNGNTQGTGDVIIIDCVANTESMMWNYDPKTGLIVSTQGALKLVASGGSAVKAVPLATNVGTNDKWGATSLGTANDRKIYSQGTAAPGSALGIIGNLLAVVAASAADVIFTNRIPGAVAQIPDVSTSAHAQCPTGYENAGGLCVQTCPSGYTPVLFFCIGGCGSTWKGTETIAHCIKSRLLSAPKSPDSCPSGYNFKDGLCYKNCPSGSSNDWGQVLSCRSNCPSGWQQLANTCYLPPDSYTREALPEGRINLSYACPSGYSLINGLCYKDCPWGYSRDFGQMSCRKNCDSGYTQYANTCTSGATGYTPDIKTGIAPWDACPGGYFRPTAGEWRCVQNCASGYYFNGTQCWRDPNTYGREDLGTSYSTGIAQTTSCPSGYDKLTTGCYKSCPSGYVRDAGQLTCRKTCPSDYRQDPNACVRDTKSTTRTQVATLPAGSIPTCPSGAENVSGICYPACPAGYARIPGIPMNCGEICPSGTNDIGLACEKDIKIRTIKSAADIGACPSGKQNVAGYCV
ncbi:flagellar motor rotation protein MotB [Faustovirus]|nr:flagellar motor rotation protein MotB [Faustovirus]AMN84584.1 flagellar motor rotation protein MotB [Faustovirus]AMP44275.1 Flagellar motor rotation protein MotB [Faustovirus]